METIITVFMFVLTIACAFFYVVSDWRNTKKKFDENPELRTIWNYSGGINKMRKIRINLNTMENTVFRIGFSQFGGYHFYGNFKTENGEAVIETYLGKEGCDFIFAPKDEKARLCRITLLDENDKSLVTAIYKGHWWQ